MYFIHILIEVIILTRPTMHITCSSCVKNIHYKLRKSFIMFMYNLLSLIFLIYLCTFDTSG